MPHCMYVPAGLTTWKFESAKPSGVITTPDPPPFPPGSNTATAVFIARVDGRDPGLFGLQDRRRWLLRRRRGSPGNRPAAMATSSGRSTDDSCWFI